MSGQPEGQWTLKADLAGDLRRLSPWPPVGRAPSAAAVREAVARLFDFHAEEVESLVLKYQDDEGDMCTLTESSLTDALCLASEKSCRVLRVNVLREAARRPASSAGTPTPAQGRAGGQGAAQAGGPPPPSAQGWARLKRLSQRVQEEVHTRTAELRAAAAEPNGLRAYSEVLQGRINSHVEDARTAAAQVRSAAAGAYSQASQGDAKAGLGLAAAVALPAAAVALAPGRCARLGMLAAGALAAAKLGDSLAGSSPQETERPAQEPPAQEREEEAVVGGQEMAEEANTPSDGVVRQRAEPSAQQD